MKQPETETYDSYCWFIYPAISKDGERVGTVQELFPPSGQENTYGNKTPTEIRALAFVRLSELEREHDTENVKVDMSLYRIINECGEECSVHSTLEEAKAALAVTEKHMDDSMSYEIKRITNLTPSLSSVIVAGELLARQVWTIASGTDEAMPVEYKVILIEEEYGFKYWMWFCLGTIEECLKRFADNRPDSCLVEVSVLNDGQASIVSEINYEIYDAAMYIADGQAHWHEPDDSNIYIKDETGKRFGWYEVEMIKSRCPDCVDNPRGWCDSHIPVEDLCKKHDCCEDCLHCEACHDECDHPNCRYGRKTT